MTIARHTALLALLDHALNCDDCQLTTTPSYTRSSPLLDPLGQWVLCKSGDDLRTVYLKERAKSTVRRKRKQ